jgi:hypothetical protein
MVGMKPLAEGWKVQTLICDATGDPELLRAIWPELEAEPEPWPQLPRPESVQVFQCVDRTLSKYAVAVESKLKDGPKREQDLERRADSARKMYAALLMKALQYGGADVGVIVYKSTEEWIRKNCFVPEWLKLAHHGGVAGSNMFENVRALFEVGRMQPPPEAIVRMAEALFGEFISQREYVKVKRKIPIIPDEAGNNVIEVSRQYRLRNPKGQRLLWQAREGGTIQNEGRARAGLRTPETPLDIFRWTDCPIPELGPVEPVLWAEIEAGLDALMLATAGVWLENIPDAAQAFNGLFTNDGLKSARRNPARGQKARGEGVALIDISLLAQHPHLAHNHAYKRAGPGRRLARAVSLLDPAATRAWLEEKLGPLVEFDGAAILRRHA